MLYMAWVQKAVRFISRGAGGGRGGELSKQVFSERFRHEAQPLNLIYTIFKPFFVSFIEKILPLSHTYLIRIDR